MKINICGNVLEGKGLASDSRVLRSFLSGHDIIDVQYDEKACRYADLNIFLEVANPGLHRFADRNIILPNVELWMDAHSNVYYDAILTKTRHAQETMTRIGKESEYIGFTSEDLMQLDIERENCALHVAGGGRFRNTWAVVEAWRMNWRPGDPRLTVIAQRLVTDYLHIRREVLGVRFVERIKSRAEFINEFNRHRYHILPSQYEGFGTSLWEARSVGAVIITTDAPPMNEAHAHDYVPVVRHQVIRKHCLVEGSIVSPDDIWEAMPKSEQKVSSKRARRAWEKGREDFKSNFKRAINAVMDQPKRQQITTAQNRVIAVIATIKGRERECYLARKSLERQGITVHVWSRPVWDEWKKCNREDDARKFIIPVGDYSGFILTCDDDLIYPDTYVEEMIAAVTRYDGVVSLHGQSFEPPIETYYHGFSEKYRCRLDVENDVRVQIPGTGTLAFHTDLIRFSLEDFPTENMADIHVGIKCNHMQMPVYVIAHAGDWLVYQNVRNTIWDRMNRNDKIQTLLVNDTAWHDFKR